MRRMYTPGRCGTSTAERGGVRQVAFFNSEYSVQKPLRLFTCVVVSYRRLFARS